MASTYGTVEKHGPAAIARSKQVRRGPGQKNLGPSRNSKPSNAGMRTEPIKGPDKGTG